MNISKHKKAISKYLAKEAPFPFPGKAEYEMTLEQPLGKHWNTASSAAKLCKPKLKIQSGSVIRPMKKGFNIK